MIYNAFGTLINDNLVPVAAPIQGKMPSIANQTISPSIVSGGQSYNYVPGASGWSIFPGGQVEFGSGYFRGDVTGASGTFGGILRATQGEIGGFTITLGNLYGGVIQTGETVGAGSSGVIMDTAGLRGYSANLGEVFNVKTDGTPPFFSGGVIDQVIINQGTLQSADIIGGTITGNTITGGILQTATSGQRTYIDDGGIRLLAGNVGVTYGDSSKKYGDSSRKYGSGTIAYINNTAVKVPFYISQLQNVADFHYYNRGSNPSGAAEIGDMSVVNTKLMICTASGTPGSWTVAGTQS